MILADLKNKQIAFKSSTTLADVKDLIDQLDQESLHELEVLPTEIRRDIDMLGWKYNKEDSINYTIQFV